MKSPLSHSLRPTVNVTFTSWAQEYGRLLYSYNIMSNDSNLSTSNVVTVRNETIFDLTSTTLCSKKSDAKIEITITTSNLIRIKHPLSNFNYHLSGTNVVNFNKIHCTVSEQQLLKNETQKHRFPIWKIPISLLTARSVANNDIMLNHSQGPETSLL